MISPRDVSPTLPHPMRRSILTPFLLSAGLAFAMTSLLRGCEFAQFEALTYDLRQQLTPNPPTSGRFVTVTVPGDDQKQWGERWNADQVETVLTALSARHPREIIWAFSSSQLSQDPQEQRRLRQLFDRFENLYLFTSPHWKRENGYLDLDAFRTFPRHLPIILPMDTSVLARDGRQRRFALNANASYQLDAEVLQLSQTLKIPIAFEEFRHTHPFHGVLTPYMKYRAFGTYGQLRLVQLMESPATEDWSQKTVIIGAYSTFDGFGPLGIFRRWGSVLDGYANQIYWPVNEVLANLLDDLTLTEYLRFFSRPTEQVMCFVTLFLYLFCLLMLAPIPAAIFSLSYVGAYVAICWATYWATSFVIEMTRPLTAMIIVQYFALPAILIRYIRHRDRELAERQREAEVNLVQSRVIAKSARADLGLRIAMQVAHDLKSPIMAVNVVADRAKRELNEDMRLMLKTATSRLQTLSQELIERYKVGFLNLNQTVSGCDAVEVTEELLKEYRRSWDKVKFQFISELVHIPISLARLEFERVLTNLMNNAIEAMSNHSIPNPEIEIRLSVQASTLHLSVRDNGPGVPASVRSQIFDEGFTHGKWRGSGLGLAQARKVFEREGGSLALQESSSGAFFEGTLPLVQSLLKMAMTEPIVVVEDSRETLQLLKDLLSRAELQFQIFSTPAEAQAAINELHSQKRPFSLLTDLIFQGEELTGFDLLSQAGPSCHERVLCTSLADSGDIRKMADTLGARLLAKSDLTRVQFTSMS